MTIDTLKVAVPPAAGTGGKAGDGQDRDVSAPKSFGATLAAQSERTAAGDKIRPGSGAPAQIPPEAGKPAHGRDAQGRSAPHAHATREQDGRVEASTADDNTPAPAFGWQAPGLMPDHPMAGPLPDGAAVKANAGTARSIDAPPPGMAARARDGGDSPRATEAAASTIPAGADAARFVDGLIRGAATPAQPGNGNPHAIVASMTTPQRADTGVETVIANTRALVSRRADLARDAGIAGGRAGAAPNLDIALERMAPQADPARENTDFARAPDSRLTSMEELFRSAKRSLSTPGDAAGAITSGPAGTASVHHAAAPMTAAAAQAPSFGATLSAPLGSEAWNQALNQQALRLSHVGDGTAELTLHPRDLGKLHVSLKMGEQAQLHFASPHADVRAAVESALPQLRHAFADNGINLGQTSVSDQGQGGNQGRDGADAFPRPNEAGGMLGDGTAADDERATAALRITAIAGRTPAGGIDIFA